jgi:hypothetical protein
MTPEVEKQEAVGEENLEQYCYRLLVRLAAVHSLIALRRSTFFASVGPYIMKLCVPSVLHSSRRSVMILLNTIRLLDSQIFVVTVIKTVVHSFRCASGMSL